MITRMFKEEGGALFDSRSANLGHTLQGNVPTPMDRARAVRLALKCMIFLETEHGKIMAQPTRSRQASPDSAATITMQGSSIEWVPVQEMVKHADMKNRRGKTAWWMDMKDLTEALVARHQLV